MYNFIFIERLKKNTVRYLKLFVKYQYLKSIDLLRKSFIHLKLRSKSSSKFNKTKQKIHVKLYKIIKFVITCRS